ncbi:MAG: hypothetical protein ACI9JT_001415 [Polaribacter sp.]|jgi:hypothetical protein
MIIYTSLFFNRVGNQSMFETIRGYSKHYNVYIITSSSKEETYYLDFKKAKEMLPNNVFFYRTPQFFHTILRGVFKLINKSNKAKLNVELKKDSTLINLNYTFWNKMSFKTSYFIQIIFSFYLFITNKIKSPNLICAYEIGGVTASKFINKFFKKSQLIAKMQGTVLYNYIIKNDINSKSISLDVEAYNELKFFDLVTMTNDGTFGNKVLDYFKVKNENQIFITNGISNFMIRSKEGLIYDHLKNDDTIKITTISRLIGWKRVYLTIEVINEVVNVYNKKNVSLNIYGFGDENEKLILINLINKYNLSAYVSLNGSVDYHMVPEILNKSDFLLSLYKMTNVTNPLLEAVYLNVPIISIEDVNLLNVINNDSKCNNFLFKEMGTEEELIKQVSDFILNLEIEKIRITRRKIIEKGVNPLISWDKRVELEIEIINESCK